MRRQHHLHIAQVLGERFPEVAETRPELLAHHYTEAGQIQPAIHYWKLAGLRASQHSANQEAVSHLSQALKLLRSLPDAATLTKEELQLLIALGLPLVHVQGFRSPEVENTYTRVKLLLHEVGELLVDLGQRQHNWEMLSMGHRMLATDFFTWGQMSSALRHVEQALVLMRQVLEPWTHSGIIAGMHHNLGMLASIHLRLGLAQAGLAVVDEALTWPPVTEAYSYLPELHRMESLRRQLLEQGLRDAP